MSKLALSKDDYKFLMNMLDEAEAEAYTGIRIDGDNKAETTLAVERITQIRLAIIELEGSMK